MTPFHVLSDHALIKLGISIPQRNYLHTDNTKLLPLPCRYKWDPRSEEKFLKAFATNTVQHQITLVQSEKFANTANGIDELCSKVKTIYQTAANIGLTVKKTFSNKKIKHNSLVNQTYNNTKSQIRQLANLLQKYPNDPILRGKYITSKKNLRKKLKKARLVERETLLEKLQESEEKDPEAFWRLIQNIRSKQDNNESIEPEIFLNYFKTLHKANPQNNFDDRFALKVKQALEKQNKITHTEALDREITEKEILDNTCTLKNKKASGLDSISNEMLKSSIQIMLPSIKKLFNHIINTEIFPQEWAKGLILPIFKTGDRDDPSNYRGITISNCIGKLFTRIFNNRLIRFATEHNFITKNQIGFLPKHRTSDHILVLKTIIDTFKHNRKTLYMCFIDLKKAFDTVFHEGLLFKLSRMKISTKFTNIVSSMYSNVSAQVKTATGLTEDFTIEIGTRQGCNLSPSLFNMYINDLHKQLAKCGEPSIQLGDLKLDCLMYADNIVLLADSAPRMEKKLQTLERFCKKWRLTISTAKSKLIIINQPKSLKSTFKIYNSKIEIVDSYCYLGIVISKRGNFKEAIEQLTKKASRAYYSTHKEFNFENNTKPKTIIKLFDSTIKPILTYGSEIWSLFGWCKNTLSSIHKFLFNENHTFEKLHTRACRNALGVHRKATAALVKA